VQSHPDVRISVTGGESGTGIASLLSGTIQLANDSREMSKEEIHEARTKGFIPVRCTVALDASAVGREDRPIVRLSRESNSGPYVYFLEPVLRRGHRKNTALFSPEMLCMPFSEGISLEVRQNRNTIGYDGLGHVTLDQKLG
jgi:phosphate transport system substrate-binding protein